MAGAVVGVDIGYDNLKIALCKNGVLRKAAAAPMPENLLREGRITSPEAMADLLKRAMRKNGIRAADGALVLPGEITYVRTVTMPRMSAEQLAINLPYEFHDYISGELKSYIFDYAMISTPAELKKGDGNGEMELMAAAVPKDVVDTAREVFRRAGLRLKRAAPALSSYISLIRGVQDQDDIREYCILDLGFQSIRMHMFQDDRHVASRELEMGLSILDGAIAEARGVDEHLAHTYLVSNYENCQSEPYCTAAYGNIAVELMRALNFYHFSNPESDLKDIWLCGGGAVIEPLRDAIAEALDLTLHRSAELVPGGEQVEDCYHYLEAIGATLD